MTVAGHVSSPDVHCVAVVGHVPIQILGSVVLHPHRINPSSTISVEACEKYFLKFFSTSEASSGHPLIIIHDSACGSGSAAITS